MLLKTSLLPHLNAVFLLNRSENCPECQIQFNCVCGIVPICAVSLYFIHDWLKNARYCFFQSEVKLKAIVIRSRSFFRASRQLHVLL